MSDIKDGLFRLILYANLDSLTLVGTQVSFETRLKLTGKEVKGALAFPCSEGKLKIFVAANAARLKKRHLDTCEKLNLEATNNKNLEIEIQGNS